MAIPYPGTYSLTVDNSLVLTGEGEHAATFWTLEEARFAARMLCGASIIVWRRTDSGNGRTSEPVERVPAPDWQAMPVLDLTAAPGRYVVPASLASFAAACKARGLAVGASYNYSGPSRLVEVSDGMRIYSMREYESGRNELTIKQRTL